VGQPLAKLADVVQPNKTQKLVSVRENFGIVTRLCVRYIVCVCVCVCVCV